jgi:hypothetical protein
MLPLSIGGLVVLRKRRVPIFPFIAIAVSVTVTVALSFGITRYRAPFDVVMPVLAAVAIDAFVRWRRHTPEPVPLDDPGAPELDEVTTSLPG